MTLPHNLLTTNRFPLKLFRLMSISFLEQLSDSLLWSGV